MNNEQIQTIFNTIQVSTDTNAKTVLSVLAEDINLSDLRQTIITEEKTTRGQTTPYLEAIIYQKPETQTLLKSINPDEERTFAQDHTLSVSACQIPTNYLPDNATDIHIASFAADLATLKSLYRPLSANEALERTNDKTARFGARKDNNRYDNKNNTYAPLELAISAYLADIWEQKKSTTNALSPLIDKVSDLLGTKIITDTDILNKNKKRFHDTFNFLLDQGAKVNQIAYYASSTANCCDPQQPEFSFESMTLAECITEHEEHFEKNFVERINRLELV